MAVSPSWITLPERYKVVGHIANGGMASVWEAHDDVLGRDVAVKVLAPHLSEDDRARKRFAREARAAAGVSSHPNVVTIYDVGEHEGKSFIVMELYRGGTVADRLRRGAVTRETALRWLAEAAAALDTAHAAGIVHRDIKPGNLLLDEHDRLAIADFGIASLGLEESLTSTGIVLGTAAYISPEQAEGLNATDASDRYALATVAFELLTGRKPFQAEHFAAQARMHIEDPPPPAGISAGVDAALARGMAKDPGERWPSSAAFVAALEAEPTAATTPVERTAPFAATRRAAAVPPAPSRSAGAAASPPRSARRPMPAAAGTPGPRRALWAALALVAAAAIALALILGGGDGDEGRQAADPTATPKAEKKKDEQPEDEATAAPTAQATQDPAAGGATSIAEARSLHNQAFEANNAGDFATGERLERQALEACGDSGPENPCAYALYELGRTLNALGRPDEAIPYLEERLARYGDNDAGDVQRELDAAYAAAGGNGNGNGNGKAKGKDKD